MTASEIFNRQMFEYHPVYGHRFIPGIKARVPHEAGGYLARVNGAGFRCDREFVLARTPGKKRALLFGDSFTAGDGVSNGKRFGDLLETFVPNLEVFNYGLPGTGTDQQYLVWREEATEIEHDVLILAVQVENIRRNVSRYRPYENDKGETAIFAKPYFELKGEALVLNGVPPRREAIPVEELPESERGHLDSGGRFQGLRSVVAALGLKELAQRVTRYQPLPEYNDANDSSWRLMRAILEKWVREHGTSTPVLIVPVPLYMYVEGTSDPSLYQARFGELSAACGDGGAGTHLHDPLPDLLKYSHDARRAMRFDQDVHPSPAGHEALAKSIAPAVEFTLKARVG